MKNAFTLLTVLLLPPLAAVYAADSPEQRHSEVKIAAGKPNIIVIFTDDQTYRGVGYNNPEVKTPNLDALAASGITFQRGYVASPICAAEEIPWDGCGQSLRVTLPPLTVCVFHWRAETAAGPAR
jgi:hypothetical protein